MGHEVRSLAGTVAVNVEIRRAAANLALIIKECGLSQSELSRRSGLSRQLINGWARQRVPVSLSTNVGRLLSSIHFTLSDLLLAEPQLYMKLGKTPPNEAGAAQILPHLLRLAKSDRAQKRLDVISGTFRFRTRLKETPIFVQERTFQFRPREERGPTVKVFDGQSIGNRPLAEGHCFHHQSIFFVFVECTEAPHQPLLYAYRDPQTAGIESLNGVAITPAGDQQNIGHPLTRLVYMHRVNADGTAISQADIDPEHEFNNFIPADGCTVLTTL